MKKEELSFEDNLKKLETIVRELETGEVPLDDAINKFTEASNIAKKCDEKLKTATDQINKIMNEDGTLKDFNVEE